jgi:hypothetical protein
LQEDKNPSLARTALVANNQAQSPSHSAVAACASATGRKGGIMGTLSSRGFRGRDHRSNLHRRGSARSSIHPLCASAGALNSSAGSGEFAIVLSQTLPGMWSGRVGTAIRP